MVSLHICSRIAWYGWAFVVICPRFAAGYLRSKGKFTPSAHDGTVGNPRLEPAEPGWIHRRWFVSVTSMQFIIPHAVAVRDPGMSGNSMRKNRETRWDPMRFDDARTMVGFCGAVLNRDSVWLRL